MMKDWLEMDFQRVVQEVKAERWGKERLTIWGGTCGREELADFWSIWPLEQMPYRIYQSAAQIIYQKDALPADGTLWERVRFFGPGGDLALCLRDGDYTWRFIGPADLRRPDSSLKILDYWEYNPDITFHCYGEKALLWGELQGERWQDGRVAAARLEYPLRAGRVYLQYKVFSRAGRTQFVWYTGLIAGEEAEHAGRAD